MGKVIRRGAAVRQKAIEILRNGGTLDDAAKATGYGRAYVRQLGAKEGIRFPKKKYNHDEIIQLYQAGLAPTEIMDKVGAKYISAVYRILNSNGIHYSKKEKQVVVDVLRFCKECNTAFLCHPNSNKIFCTKTCEKKSSHRKNDIIRRARKQNVIINDDITLKKLCIRDKNICYLCGLEIDWNDCKTVNGKKYASGNYPSIDHMVPLSRGGVHSWDNIKLAHFSCNASKGVSLVG